MAGEKDVSSRYLFDLLEGKYLPGMLVESSGETYRLAFQEDTGTWRGSKDGCRMLFLVHRPFRVGPKGLSDLCTVGAIRSILEGEINFVEGTRALLTGGSISTESK